MAAKPIPDGFHTVTPYLMVEGAEKVMQFLINAFGAKVTEQVKRPDGKIGHAQLQIGSSIIMMGEWSDCASSKPTHTAIYLYVPDCDTTYKQAIRAGGVSLSEPQNQFYGDRHGGVKDPSGNIWWIATHVEDVSPEELQKRAKAAMSRKPELAGASA